MAAIAVASLIKSQQSLEARVDILKLIVIGIDDKYQSLTRRWMTE
jgi:hypothetical protein